MAEPSLAIGSGARRWSRPTPWLVTAAKSAVAIGLIILLGFAVDWRGSLEHLMTAAPGWIALAVAAGFAGLALSAWRWERLMRVLGARFGLYPALKAYWVGSLFGNVLPSTVGGDVVRVALARKSLGFANATASIAVERLTGLVALLALALLALLPPAAAIMLGHHRWWLFAGLAGVLVAGVGLVALAPQSFVAGSRARLRRYLLRFPRIVKLLDKGRGFAQALLVYRQRPTSLVVTLALSTLFYGVLAVFQWALLHAVGAEIGLLEAAIAVPLVILVNLLPISINGLGVTEGTFVLLYTRLGVPAEVALSAAILRRLVIIAVTSIGLVYWTRSEALAANA